MISLSRADDLDSTSETYDIGWVWMGSRITIESETTSSPVLDDLNISILYSSYRVGSSCLKNVENLADTPQW
jgi:hypothetical protein